MKSTKRTLLGLTIAAALGTATYANANTTSAIRGNITGPQGQAAAGTKVVITHVGSGTTKTVTVNDAGQFTAQGLRVGGPYKIMIDSDQFRDATVNNVFLSLGDTYRLNQQLENQELETIVVTGAPVLFNSAANESYYGSEQIANSPSLNRDLKDVVRNNPLVVIKPGDDSSMTIAGSNPRMNSISIDGIPLNDDFGLNNNGYPTQRNPFPLDALDQVTVSVAPTHAKSSGFTGGSVDAVFKSGTNEFHGDFFFEKSNDSMAGTPEHDGEEIEIDFEEENYGFTLGGPIVEDKLFFFMAYEKFESPQVLEYSAGGSSAGANQTTVTADEVAKVKEIASRVYGLDNIGEFDTQPLLEDEKYIVKLDWNINDYHRANFVYMFNEGNDTRNMTSSQRELRLDTHWYNKGEELNNYSVKLFSDWTDEFSSEISVTQKSVETGQVSLKSDLGIGDITINNIDEDNDGNSGSIAFGSDQYRHSNSLSNDLTILKFDGTYLFDEHQLDFGIDYKILEVENQFLPNSRGSVTFNSLEDFENRMAAQYVYENGVGNDPLAVAANFERNDLALYVNDTWDIADDLTLSFGLRYERFSSDDKPTFNADLLERTGFDNTFNLDGVDIILPRFGFTYDASEDVTIRGSIGRYAGGNPNVWISNSYSNDGVSKQSVSASDLLVPTNILTTPPQDAQDAINAGLGTTVANLIDPDFDIPSQWTYMLNADVTFDIPGVGDNFQWTNTAIYTKKENSAEWINAALLQEGDVVGSTSSGVLPFYDTRELDIMLTNADKDGDSTIFSTGLTKKWDNGFDFNVAYTNQDIQEGNPGGSSTARSNYRYGHFLDHQKTQIGTSPYETEHRFVLSVGYNTELFEGYNTNINLFYERNSGSAYSYLVDLSNLQGGRFFNQDLIQPSGFFTTFGGNYLAYVPTANDPNVRYEGITEAEVLSYFDSLGLSGSAGSHVEKGSARSPWVTSLDLSIRQQVPGFAEGHKGEVYFVVNNLLNLLDSSKGKVYTQEFNTREIIQMDIDETTGQYIYGPLVQDDYKFEAKQSAYRIKVGVKYSF